MDKKTLIIIIGAMFSLVLLNTAMSMSQNKLPSSLIRQYNTEEKLFRQEAGMIRERAGAIRSKLDQNKVFLAGVADKRGWLSRLTDIENMIDKDEKLLNEKLTPLLKKAKRTDQPVLAGYTLRLKNDRTSAVRDTGSILSDLDKFVYFHDQPQEITRRADDDYQFIQNHDLSSLERKVELAQSDWPQKRDDLSDRMAIMSQIKARSSQDYKKIQTLAASGGDWVSRGMAAEALAENRKNLEKSAKNISSLVEQLYYSRDKILDDMETGSNNQFFHKYKIIKIDRNNNQDIEYKFEEVTPRHYNSHKENLGMTLESKPKGLYEFETQKTVTPPGYAYVGNRNYGRWERNRSGVSFWAFYGQYRFLQSMFWGSYYQPIYYRDYNTFQSFRNSGRTYYGSGTQKRYGSRGSFTAKKYSSSKYMKSGGYSGSKYMKSGKGSYSKRRTASAGRGFSSMSGGSIYRGK